MLVIDDLQIMFYSSPVDMRKSIDTLCVLITETLKRNPMDGTLFLFRNRTGNKLKALYYEANCFTIWYRRLEKGRYVFQRNLQGQIEMTREHFDGYWRVINTHIVMQLYLMKLVISIKKPRRLCVNLIRLAHENKYKKASQIH